MRSGGGAIELGCNDVGIAWEGMTVGGWFERKRCEREEMRGERTRERKRWRRKEEKDGGAGFEGDEGTLGFFRFFSFFSFSSFPFKSRV